MKGKSPSVHRFARVEAGLRQLLRRDALPPKIDCAATGTGDRPYNILVVGELWARGGRFFPELPETVSGRLGGRLVRACSIGFSGRNSIRLERELKAGFDHDAIRALFGGAAPDNVIILSGVNDVTQHIGARAYAARTRNIASYLAIDGSIVQVVEVPRVDERHAAISNVLGRAKRFVQKWLYDRGSNVVAERYRQELRSADPLLATIAFDKFIPTFEGNEHLYADDGLHLRIEVFHRYGTFLGNELLLSR